MKMKRYFNYLDAQFEPQPLYLFDRNYPTRAPAMASDYRFTIDSSFPSLPLVSHCTTLFGISIPPFFEEDLFKITGEDDRPPYKWILIGLICFKLREE